MGSRKLHQVLLSCGYRFTPARQMPSGLVLDNKSRRKGYYVKDFDTQAGLFKIALVVWNDPNIELPTACVIDIPSCLSNLLIPHISLEGILCYVEQMEADWDSNNLDGTYREVDVQIRNTLERAVSSALSGDPDDRELEGEFAAYWRPHDDLYLLSSADRRTELKTKISQSVWADESPRLEYISVANDEPDSTTKNWLFHRGLPASSLTDSLITTHFVLVKPNKLAGVKWPPSSFKDVLSWLRQVDHNSRDKVVEYIVLSGAKRHIFLLEIFNQETVAVYVEINTQAINLERHKKFKTVRKSKATLAEMLGGKSASVCFKRLSVTRADLGTLLSRNLPREGLGSLSEKRIALIGCGTIGGYLAELLLRGGAGCGKGYFHIYDNDTYSPHNFGRHVLTASDFGRYKSYALAKKLRNSVHTPTDILGYAAQYPLKSDIFKKYDIIIDSAGRPPVSKRIAAVLREVDFDSRPVVIHAFNDGNGRASKVFVDNGSASCYGCMLVNPEKYRDGVDLRFVRLDLFAEKFKSCGSTYTPYDAAVSQITAALAQTAVLNTLEAETKWTYIECMLDGSRSFKPQIVPQQLKCSICNGA